MDRVKEQEMKKKIWAAALICIVVLGMLDGCGPKEKDTDKEAAGNTETEAVEGREYRCDKKCQCIQYGRNHGW